MNHKNHKKDHLGALSKLKHKLSSKSNPDAFFIAHHHSQLKDKRTHSVPNVLKKRIAFVSLIGLYHSWRECPSSILYSAIFILPLKKEWIYQHKRNKRSHQFSFLIEDTSFIHLLQWKDKQGLVFWMKDPIPLSILYKVYNDDSTDISRDIDAYWIYLSYKISSLYDPITEKHYQPLLLNVKWWRNQYKECGSSADEICKELHRVSMKFKPIQDILQESNPSLNVITMYNDEQLCDTPQTTIQSWNSFSDKSQEMVETPIDHNVWWISPDYDDDDGDDDDDEKDNE